MGRPLFRLPLSRSLDQKTSELFSSMYHSILSLTYTVLLSLPSDPIPGCLVFLSGAIFNSKELVQNQK